MCYFYTIKSMKLIINININSIIKSFNKYVNKNEIKIKRFQNNIFYFVIGKRLIYIFLYF